MTAGESLFARQLAIHAMATTMPRRRHRSGWAKWAFLVLVAAWVIGREIVR